jgi:hypothetical protein
MIRENLSSLKSFDQNKDDLIDEEELSKALATTLEWASFARRDEGGWIYYGTKGSVGPESWNEIKYIAQKHPEVFISRANSGYWLPAKIVLLAIQLD